MLALARIVQIAVAGAILYYAGIVNAIVLDKPTRVGAAIVVVAVAAALVLLVRATRGTGAGDATTAAPHAGAIRLHRLAWLFVCVMALVALAWAGVLPRQRSFDWTPYHNDAIALSECAAELITQGRDPYTELDLFDCYRSRSLGPDRTTPLRRGMFADVVVYPDDDQLDAAWAARSGGPGQGDDLEFVWRPSYPALAFLGIAPWVAAGWDTNVLYAICLAVAMGLIVARSRASLRPFVLTGLLGTVAPVAFTVGGSSDLLYALPLLVAWLWRERGWSAVAYGLAAATKQLAWFFAPFLFIQWTVAHGLRTALRRSGVAALVFAVANAPLVVPDPGAWLRGVLTPIAEPMFPRGSGLVLLSTGDVLPLLPASVYLALEVAAFAAALIVAWRTRRTSPELGAVLAVVPLFFAYRSLFSYFFLLPLFAMAGVVRMPLGELRPQAARALGALTLFAEPKRS